MRNLLGQDTLVGYCTNVHSGTTWRQILDQLSRHAVKVKGLVSPGEPMGIGLWLPASAARQILSEQRLDEFAEWMTATGLIAFTINGFPYGDFHQPVVKHRVYEPDWRKASRALYTLDLIRILARLLPENTEGSISTLPIGWRQAVCGSANIALAVQRLLEVVDHLASVEAETGKLIHLDLEPEPGCYLQRGEDVLSFFRDHLLTTKDDERVRRYLRVCHDVCHAAVMFEDQAAVLQGYRAAGIQVGKIQISSAARVPFDLLIAEQRKAALQQLRQFAEDRYLHQTVVTRKDRSSSFYEDLPQALAATSGHQQPAGEWRIHFHVPIYLERFGLIETTQQQILECLRIAKEYGTTRHFEVETYAWNVLPENLRQDDLDSGVARELSWLRAHAGTELAV